MSPLRGPRGAPAAPAAAALAVALLLGGCAWFRTPYPPRIASPSASAPEAGTVSPDSIPPPPAPGEAPADSGGPAAPGEDAAAADAAVPDSALGGPDAWDLNGQNLRGSTQDGEQVLLIDRPVILHRGMTVEAREGTYFVDRGLGRLTGDVRFADRDLFGRSDLAIYDRAAGILTATGNVEIDGDSLNVTAERVTYDRDADTVEAAGNVEAWHGARQILAGRATWDRAAGTVLLSGSARVTDPAERSSVTGETILYELDRGTARVLGTPELVVRPADGGTMWIRGERLWLAENGDAFAAVGVTVRRGFVTGFADSAAFFRDLGYAVLLGAPRVEEPNGTLHGDTLFLRFDEADALRRVDVHGDAFVRYAPRDTASRGEVSIVQGDSLTMEFAGSEAERIVVTGRANSSYVPPASTDPDDYGSNTARGDTITIFLAAGEVERVEVAGSASGVYAFGGSREADSTAAEAAAARGSAAAGDSLAGASDALAASFDSLGGSPDSLTAPPDSLGGSPDSLTAPPDSPGGSPDSPPGPFDAPPGDAVPVPRDLHAAPRDSAGARPGLPGAPGLMRSVPPPSGEGRERVEYQAERVVFSLAGKTVDLRGKAKVDYGPITLTAGTMRFFADRRYLEAEEDPVLVDRGGGGQRDVKGERMDYNLRTREGTIDDGLTKAEEGYLYAERLRQIGEDDFLAGRGNSTSCDLVEKGEKPHYHFSSRRMRIYLKDKVVARPVVLYIREIPVFALPFYVFSIRKGRHSGFLTPDLDFGLGSTQGRFFRNLGYYWATNDYLDLTFGTDYQETPSRFTGRLGARYAKRYLLSGNATFAQTFGEEGESFRDVTAAHEMTLGDWRVTGRGEFRDREFRREEPLGGSLGQRLDRFLVSDLSVSRSFAMGASFSGQFSRREDLDATFEDGRDEQILQETLPTYSFNLNSRTIGREPDRNGEGGRWPGLASVRWSFRSSGGTTRTSTERTTTVENEGGADSLLYAIIDERTSSARHGLNLSDRRKILGALSFGPSLDATEHWVDREFSDADTVKGFRRALTWSGGMSAGTTFYGTFPGVGPIVALRHTVSPNVGFSFQPEFDALTYLDSTFTASDTTVVRRNRFPGVGGSERRFLNLSVDNRFQAKARGEQGVKRLDLFSWNLDTSYDLVAAGEGERAWSDVGSSVTLNRIAGVSLSFTSSHDPYERFRFDNFRANGAFTLRGALPGADAGTPAGDAPEEPAAGDEEDLSLDQRGGDVARGIRGPGDRRGSARTLGWTGSFGFSWSGSRVGDRIDTDALLNSSLSLQITRNWAIDYHNTWKISDGDVVGEGFTLRRDLHCWEASFTGSRLGDDTTFYIRINVKAMPDIKVEQGRRGGADFGGLTSFLP